MRVVTWNVWGCYGRWEERQAALEAVLGEARPDVVCLGESWSRQETTQPTRIAEQLGVEHSLFSGVRTRPSSPWPHHRCQRRPGCKGRRKVVEVGAGVRRAQRA